MCHWPRRDLSLSLCVILTVAKRRGWAVPVTCNHPPRSILRTAACALRHLPRTSAAAAPACLPLLPHRRLHRCCRPAFCLRRGCTLRTWPAYRLCSCGRRQRRVAFVRGILPCAWWRHCRLGDAFLLLPPRVRLLLRLPVLPTLLPPPLPAY